MFLLLFSSSSKRLEHKSLCCSLYPDLVVAWFRTFALSSYNGMQRSFDPILEEFSISQRNRAQSIMWRIYVAIKPAMPEEFDLSSWPHITSKLTRWSLSSLSRQSDVKLAHPGPQWAVASRIIYYMTLCGDYCRNNLYSIVFFGRFF